MYYPRNLKGKRGKNIFTRSKRGKTLSTEEFSHESICSQYLTIDNVTGMPFEHVVAPETHPLWPRTPRGFR